MRVSLWDLDWYHKFSFSPNYKVQKIASFHKQRGDLVNFIEDKYSIDFEYDLMYIVKDKKITPMPPSKFIDNVKVKLVGKEFDYYDNYYVLPSVIDMVRPDYSLYDIDDKNVYANANMLQLLHGTQFLPARQDHINYAAKASRNVIVDEKLWNTTDETLQKCFDVIKQYKNISFLSPISLKRVMQSNFINQFVELSFLRDSIIKFKNDYGSDFESVKKIVDMMVLLKQNNKSIGLKAFPVKGVLYDHWKDRDSGIKDLERVLKILDYSKERKIKIIVKTPNERTATPYWAFFDLMEVWTNEYYNISYIEAMISTRQRVTGEQWHEIVNDPKKWSTPRIYFLINLMVKYKSIIFNYGFRRWGEDKLDTNWVDLNQIVKIKNTFEREDILEKLQKEILSEES